MGQLAECRVVRKIVSPKFDKFTCSRACAIEGDEVLTLRWEGHGTQKLFVDTSVILGEKWRPPLMAEDWVAICQANGVGKLKEMHENRKQVSWRIGVRKQVKESQAWANWHTEKKIVKTSFLQKDDQMRAFKRRSEMRESLLEAWKIDISQPRHICEECQVKIDESVMSYVSWDPIEEPWRRQDVPALSGL